MRNRNQRSVMENLCMQKIDAIYTQREKEFDTNEYTVFPIATVTKTNYNNPN